MKLINLLCSAILCMLLREKGTQRSSQRKYSFQFVNGHLNPSSPNCDQDQISPSDINAKAIKGVMRI